MIDNLGAIVALYLKLELLLLLVFVLHKLEVRVMLCLWYGWLGNKALWYRRRRIILRSLGSAMPLLRASCHGGGQAALFSPHIAQLWLAYHPHGGQAPEVQMRCKAGHGTAVKRT